MTLALCSGSDTSDGSSNIVLVLALITIPTLVLLFFAL